MHLKSQFFRDMVLLLLLLCTSSVSFAETTDLNGVLTPDEISWLRAQQVIRVAPDLAYAPIEFEENGEVKGIAIDYLNWMAAHYPIKFEIVKYPTWQEQLDAMKAQQIDMLSGAAETPERSLYMHFTKPYIRTPNVILRRKDKPAIASENDFVKLKVAAIRGYAVQEYLQIRYATLEVIPVKDIEDGLVRLSNGELDAMVAEAYLASYYVSSLRMSNIVMETAYEVDFPLKLSMATRDSAPELAIILDKMIASMPESERLAIERKWIGIETAPILPRNLLLMIGGGVSLLVGALVLIVLWNRTLKGRVEEKTLALSKLNSELEQKVERRTHLLSETNKQLELSMYTLQLRDEELQDLNHELEASLDALRTSQKKVIEMEKVAALGKLVATVAHEINTPLGNCIMMTSYEWDKHLEYKHYYEHHHPVDETTEAYFDSIENVHEILRSSLDRLTLIVNRFKALAVQNLDQKQDVFDVTEVIHVCMVQYRQLQSFEWSIVPDEPIFIVGIRSAYEEVFSNLISNAVIHGFVDGFREEAKIAVKLERRSDSLIVEIQDNGIGVSDELISKVTEPLFSTNRSGGIGFNIIMNILSHTLEGEMALDNKTESGLRVVIMLRHVNWATL